MARRSVGHVAAAVAAAFIYRQGDVLLVRVPELPAALKARKRDRGRVVLAYGEVTGHAHAIARKDVVQYDAPDAVAAAKALLADVGLTVEVSEHHAPTFLEVPHGAELTHEEHATIALAPGRYVAMRQREWSDTDEPIQVAD